MVRLVVRLVVARVVNPRLLFLLHVEKVSELVANLKVKQVVERVVEKVTGYPERGIVKASA